LAGSFIGALTRSLPMLPYCFGGQLYRRADAFVADAALSIRPMMKPNTMAVPSERPGERFVMIPTRSSPASKLPATSMSAGMTRWSKNTFGATITFSAFAMSFANSLKH
jgi:hypothetical protein